MFYTKVLNEEERKRLCENIAGHLKDAQLFIQKKAVSDTLLADGTSAGQRRERSCVREPLNGNVLTILLDLIGLKKN